VQQQKCKGALLLDAGCDLVAQSVAVRTSN